MNIYFDRPNYVHIYPINTRRVCGPMHFFVRIFEFLRILIVFALSHISDTVELYRFSSCLLREVGAKGFSCRNRGFMNFMKFKILWADIFFAIRNANPTQILDLGMYFKSSRSKH